MNWYTNTLNKATCINFVEHTKPDKYYIDKWKYVVVVVVFIISVCVYCWCWCIALLLLLLLLLLSSCTRAHFDFRMKKKNMFQNGIYSHRLYAIARYVLSLRALVYLCVLLQRSKLDTNTHMRSHNHSMTKNLKLKRNFVACFSDLFTQIPSNSIQFNWIRCTLTALFCLCLSLFCQSLSNFFQSQK